MEKDEIQLMQEDVEFRRFRPNHYWSKAFKLYNENNSPKLSMGCMPCFGKVLTYHLSASK